MKRDREVKTRLNQNELDILNEDVQRSGLSRCAYLRALIVKRPIKERPCPDLLAVLKNLQQINNNMNQIALKANALGVVDAGSYFENAKLLTGTIGELLEVMFG